MKEERSTPSSPKSDNPPPKCAICLETFRDKSSSDSCMHEFCFTCLLKWSKIKPECPLCKQPFKSIIHNIKSNYEYNKHFITAVREEPTIRDQFLPPAPIPELQVWDDRSQYTHGATSASKLKVLIVVLLIATHYFFNFVNH